MRSAVLCLFLLGVLLAGCGGSSEEPVADPTAPAATAAPEEPATQEPAPEEPAPEEPPGEEPAPEESAPEEPEAGSAVTIVDFDFDPAEISVATGDTVTWTNTDSATHTVKIDERDSSGNLSQEDTFEATFDEAGSFSYACEIHSDMTGTVTVEG